VFVVFTVPGGVTGRTAHREEAQNFLAAFPDHRIQFPHKLLFGQGDMICSVHRPTGTHTGDWALPNGRVIPPTGKTMAVEMVTVAKVKDGMLVEESLYYDTLGVMAQLGLIQMTGGESKAGTS
jgi:predicted ester cyclase